eukprot:jgi/Psemu1/220961/e_gw1.1077.19.1
METPVETPVETPLKRPPVETPVETPLKRPVEWKRRLKRPLKNAGSMETPVSLQIFCVPLLLMSAPDSNFRMPDYTSYGVLVGVVNVFRPVDVLVLVVFGSL